MRRTPVVALNDVINLETKSCDDAPVGIKDSTMPSQRNWGRVVNTLHSGGRLRAATLGCFPALN